MSGNSSNRSTVPRIPTSPDALPQAEPGGFLMLRLRLRQGAQIGEAIELFVSEINRERGEVTIAIRAPRSIPIRRLK